MKQFVLLSGAILGLLSVVLGALGSHAFKKILSVDKLHSFEVGVKYQMYHALLLLILGFYFSFHSPLEKSMAWCIVLGTILFSFSIYLLSFSDYWGVNFRFLGPITPIGGALMMAGWGILVYWIFKQH